jgi:ABC-type uncharacterized transport system substrate-binding protein
VTRAAVLRDSAIAAGPGQLGAIQAVASSLGIELRPVDVRDAGEIERSLTVFAQGSNGGLIVTGSPAAAAHRELIVALAARHRMPAVYNARLYGAVGGLICYGPDLLDQFRRAAAYVDRILNRPGGNVTGVTFVVNTLGAKRLELLRELVPSATVIGLLINPGNPTSDSQTRDVQAAARAIGVEPLILNVGSERNIDAAFASAVQQRVNAVIVGADSFFVSRRDQLVGLAARHAMPAVYFLREFADIGGLVSYGPSQTDAYRLAGGYAARILKGEKPADLPVVQSVKFELVVNLKTAKALGLEVPPTLLASADEVIE